MLIANELLELQDHNIWYREIPQSDIMYETEFVLSTITNMMKVKMLQGNVMFLQQLLIKQWFSCGFLIKCVYVSEEHIASIFRVSKMIKCMLKSYTERSSPVIYDGLRVSGQQQLQQTGRRDRIVLSQWELDLQEQTAYSSNMFFKKIKQKK
jgi:hypothetical protein